MDGEVSNDGHSGKNNKQKKSVDGTSNRFEPPDGCFRTRFNGSVRHKPPQRRFLGADSLTTYAEKSEISQKRLH
jgi:hypothetical protein